MLKWFFCGFFFVSFFIDVLYIVNIDEIICFGMWMRDDARMTSFGPGKML